MDFDSIDWNQMWKEASDGHHWHKQSKAAKREVWDKRADSFSKRIDRVMDGKEGLDKDDYISKMLDRIEVRPEWTVLDIGCGPGTLAIPLAKRAKIVTALDISGVMLKHLEMNAEKSGVSNIQCVHSSWEDAFANKLVGPHDVVVASRSVTPIDIRDELSRIIAITRQAAYITTPIIHLPFDWEVYRAIGRDGKKPPSYIYIYNALYQMGIQANVEILNSRVKVQFSSVAEAMEELQWRTDPFTDDERAKLVEFLERKFAERGDSPVLTHEGKSKWALIWWRKENLE